MTDPLASIFFEPTLKLVQRRRRTETVGKFLVTVVVLCLALGSHPQTLHLLQRKLSEIHQILSYLIASSRASKGTWHVTDDHRAKWPKRGRAGSRSNTVSCPHLILLSTRATLLEGHVADSNLFRDGRSSLLWASEDSHPPLLAFPVLYRQTADSSS